ncbi:MAG: hypothetical protein ACK452_10765 [Bacteroidota bacterium]|jgi:hypothetical protein
MKDENADELNIRYTSYILKKIQLSEILLINAERKVKSVINRNSKDEAVIQLGNNFSRLILLEKIKISIQKDMINSIKKDKLNITNETNQTINKNVHSIKIEVMEIHKKIRHFVSLVSKI